MKAHPLKINTTHNNNILRKICSQSKLILANTLVKSRILILNLF